MSWTRARRLAPTLLGMALVAVVGCGGETVEEEIVEDAPPAAPAMPEAAVLDATELQTNAAAHEGQTVRLNGMTVTSALGSQAVWVELPNRNPFLVRTMSPPAAGSTVDIVGRVQPVNDAMLNEWTTSGGLTANERLQAEFATHYIAADQIQPTGGM